MSWVAFKNMRRINKLKIHFSSLRSHWRTPEDLYNLLNEEFHFDFDPCPYNNNPAFDGLTIEWGNVNFCNPPYGRMIGKWILKGFQEWQKGRTVVFLIPSRTDTRWWHKFIMKATEIRFIEGRLRFSSYHNSAPFPSAIVIFKCLNLKP